MTSKPGGLDPRVNAFRGDLADRRLEGRVAAPRFVHGEPMAVVAPVAALRGAPSAKAGLLTEALHGEEVQVFDIAEDWAWVQLIGDSYVGYVALDALGARMSEPTHRVTALRTFVYPEADLKLPPRSWLPFGARVALGAEVVTRGVAYRPLTGEPGAVASPHVATLEMPPAGDYVAVAERFVGTPYLWGGKTSLGLDCSALVQLSLGAAGLAVPRDTDLQEAALPPLAMGVAAGAELRRGDLVFWPGHVGILAAPDRLLHANAFAMEVAEEPLMPAIQRIALSGSAVRSIRRPVLPAKRSIG